MIYDLMTFMWRHRNVPAPLITQVNNAYIPPQASMCSGAYKNPSDWVISIYAWNNEIISIAVIEISKTLQYM